MDRRWLRAGVLLAGLAVAAGPLAATTVLRASALLDVRAGRLIPDAVVAVDGERIVFAGPAAGYTPPAGAQVLDLGDLTLVPGMMDLHTHLTIGSTGRRQRGLMLGMGPVDFALQAAHNARDTLAAGFTTVREAGANDHVDAALARAIGRGVAVGPRIVPSGYQISMTGGHGDEVGWPPGVFELDYRHGVADGVPALLKAVRYQIKHGARVIKLTATAGVAGLEATADAPQFSDEELAAIVAEASRHRLKVAAHAHGMRAFAPRCAPASLPSSTARSSMPRRRAR